MQRIAQFSLVCIILLTLATGCESVPTHTVQLGPPPAPILQTRAAEPVRPIPRPIRLQRPTPQEPVHPPARFTTVQPDDIQIPGGIHHSKWKLIVVHHSAAPNASPQSMHRYHLRDRKWEHGLGYHFVIGNGQAYPDGKLYVGPRWKRQQTGAHCKTHAGRYLGHWCPDNFFNKHGIGICLIGNFENERPTPAQLTTLYELIAILCEELNLGHEYIYGHGEITHRTACPGDHLLMPAVRRNVATLRTEQTPVAQRPVQPKSPPPRKTQHATFPLTEPSGH